MNIIFLLHTIFLLAILIIPFTNNRENLEFYSLLIPFLFFHWSVNDDTCALTQLEMSMTGQKKEETFMGRLVGPIYKMPDDDINKFTKSIFFLLWAIVQYRIGHFDFLINQTKQYFKEMKKAV
jgi:hypothetical protein